MLGVAELDPGRSAVACLGCSSPISWRGDVTTTGSNRLHADAFGHRVFAASEWDWERILERHSLGWVTARRGHELVGFTNVPWDGLVHAWLQDVMVASSVQRNGIGTGLVTAARGVPVTPDANGSTSTLTTNTQVSISRRAGSFRRGQDSSP